MCAGRLTNRGWILGRVRDILLVIAVNTSFEPPRLCSCGYVVLLPPIQLETGFLPGVKRPEREVNHSLPSNPEVRNVWSNISSSPKCLHGVDRENFTFAFFSGYLPEGQLAKASRRPLRRSVVLKKAYGYASIAPYNFMAQFLIKHRGKFYVKSEEQFKCPDR